MTHVNCTNPLGKYFPWWKGGWVFGLNSIQFDTSLFMGEGSLQVDLRSHRGKAAAIWLLGIVSTKLNYTLEHIQ